MDGGAVKRIEAGSVAGAHPRTFDFALAAFVTTLLTPVTCAVVGTLKQRKGVDVYDDATDFTPFRARG